MVLEDTLCVGLESDVSPWRRGTASGAPLTDNTPAHQVHKGLAGVDDAFVNQDRVDLQPELPDGDAIFPPECVEEAGY